MNLSVIWLIWGQQSPIEIIKKKKKRNSQWQVLSCRAQRGQYVGETGSPIDGHKESIGSAESLRESGRGSVGRVALNRIMLSTPIALTSAGQ